MKNIFSSAMLAPGLLAVWLNVFCPAAAGHAADPGQEPVAGSGGNSGYAEFKIVAPAPLEKNPDYYDALADLALQQHDWVAACEIYDAALAAFPRQARLRSNAAAVRDLWANAALEKQQWDAALDACDNALRQGLQPEHFRKKIAGIVQAGGRTYIRDQNLLQLEAWLGQVRTRFSQLSVLQALIPMLYTDALEALPVTDDRYYLSQGTALILSYQNFRHASHPDEVLVKNWCNRLLSELQERRAWERALHLLQAARELLPADPYLRKQEIALWSIFAQESIRGRQWEFATLICEQALDRFPQEALFQNNLKYCQQKRSQSQNTFQ